MRAEHNKCQYTEDDIETFKLLYSRGISLAEISKRMGRTKSGVLYFRKKLGLERRKAPWEPQKVAQLVDLRKRGMDWETIYLYFPDKTPEAIKERYLRAKTELRAKSNRY